MVGLLTDTGWASSGRSVRNRTAPGRGLMSVNPQGPAQSAAMCMTQRSAAPPVEGLTPASWKIQRRPISRRSATRMSDEVGRESEKSLLPVWKYTVSRKLPEEACVQRRPLLSQNGKRRKSDKSSTRDISTNSPTWRRRQILHRTPSSPT